MNAHQKPPTDIFAEMTRVVSQQAVAPASKAEDDCAFSWSRDRDDVVIQHQPAVAIYINGFGQAVVRQEASWDRDEDEVVVISPELLTAVIRRLEEVLAHLQGPG